MAFLIVPWILCIAAVVWFLQLSVVRFPIVGAAVCLFIAVSLHLNPSTNSGGDWLGVQVFYGLAFLLGFYQALKAFTR